MESESWRVGACPAYRGTMSTNEPNPGAESMDQDRTPYIQRNDALDAAPDEEAPLDDLAPEIDPGEQVQMRRDVELELESFEQGIEG